jgi:hypothetical protein
MTRILRLLPAALVSLVLFTACAAQNTASSIASANLVPNAGEVNSALTNREFKSVQDPTNRQIYHYTGGSQTFRVPTGVTRITITAKGAGTPSARGGLVKGTIGVKPGDVLTGYRRRIAERYAGRF